MNSATGVTPIRQLRYAERRIHVEPGGTQIATLTTPDRFRAATFDQGALTDDLPLGRPGAEQFEHNPFGYAAGALEYGWDLRGETREVYLRIPFYPTAPQLPIAPDADNAAQVAQVLEQTQHDWSERLDRVGLDVPVPPNVYRRALKATWRIS